MQPAVPGLLTPTSRTKPGSNHGISSGLSNFRPLCLPRDGNICVVTAQLDSSYLTRLDERTGAQRPHGPTGVTTEAAHTIPRPLDELTAESIDLPRSKYAVWRILNMFHPGISRVQACYLINSPANAMVLVPQLHDRSSRLQCYPRESAKHVDILCHALFRAAPSILCRRVVFQHRERDSKENLPLPRLLRIHRACCLLLSVSGATGYVDKLLRDMETLMKRSVLAEDGSSHLPVESAGGHGGRV